MTREEELRAAIKKIEDKCDGYRDSGDRGACYYYEGYHKIVKELKAIKKESQDAGQSSVQEQ